MFLEQTSGMLESCDTMVVVASASATGHTIFAKNSDRHPNEAQYLTEVAAATHDPGSRVTCSYITIPQAPRTYRVLGSRPYWIWGFEHGVNEAGVAVGNEALWAKSPASQEPGLLGMDLVRLVLERATNADDGLRQLTELLEEHGQGGVTSSQVAQSYHNGFMIADAETAWAVETVNRHWVAKRITDVGRISNAYSIGDDYDLISAGTIDFAVANGWYDPKSGSPFSFADAFQDRTATNYVSCSTRLGRSAELMRGKRDAGLVTIEDMMENLRDVRGEDARSWVPGGQAWSINMFAENVNGSETAASMVVDLAPGGYALLSLAAPRLSSFVPVWIDDLSTRDIPWEQPVTAADPDAWWQTEHFQRVIERDYRTLAAPAEEAFASIDQRVLQAIHALRPEDDTDAGVEASTDAGSKARIDGRRAITQMAVRMRAEFIQHYGEYLRAVADDLVDPDFVNPRSEYLLEVAAAEPKTDLASLELDRS